MIHTKYPAPEYPAAEVLHKEEMWHEERAYGSCTMRSAFDIGSAYEHAHYMIEMSFRHPIMYFLFYRWWVPLFLHEGQREKIVCWIEKLRKSHFRPYWAEFALRHPIQYALFWIVCAPFQFLIKFLTAPIKKIDTSEKLSIE